MCPASYGHTLYHCPCITFSISNSDSWNVQLMSPLWGSLSLAYVNGLPLKMGSVPLEKINQSVSYDSRDRPSFQVLCGTESTCACDGFFLRQVVPVMFSKPIFIIQTCSVCLSTGSIRQACFLCHSRVVLPWTNYCFFTFISDPLFV